jgi:hypothetical protein
MKGIEPELWPRLELANPTREYIHWVWWLDETATIQHGYLHDKTATSGYDDVDTDSMH